MFKTALKFLKNTSGNFAITFAVAAPALFGSLGLCTDYFLLYQQKSKLQQAADAAALASVKELSLAGNVKKDQIQAIAESYAYADFLKKDPPSSESLARMVSKPNLVVETVPNADESNVAVNLSYEWTPFFAQYFDSGVTPIKVTATAELAGNALTCVVGLMPPQSFAKASIHMDNKSVLKADNCAVFSNSTSKYGLRADADATMSAQTICSAGGVITFGRAEFIPQPITDCPKISDPLIDRVSPSYGACDENNLEITSDTILTEGVYCGGIKISGNAQVKLESGVYVIKDGPLIVGDSAGLFAEKVTFFLTGDDSIFEFHTDTTIDIGAKETGSTAGLLFFEDRNVDYSFEFNPFNLENLPEDVRVHRISSNNARNLLGTIYLSRSIFLIDSSAPVADASAYTAIITGRLWLQEGPILTLNADLTDTKVPVPDGLIGTEPRLKF